MSCSARQCRSTSTSTSAASLSSSSQRERLLLVGTEGGAVKLVPLPYAPTNPRDFKTLALQIAETLKPLADSPPSEPPPTLDSFESGSGDGHH